MSEQPGRNTAISEATLAQQLAARYGIELSAADLARTRQLSGLALADLDRYRDALTFQQQADEFLSILHDCRETRE